MVKNQQLFRPRQAHFSGINRDIDMLFNIPLYHAWTFKEASNVLSRVAESTVAIEWLISPSSYRQNQEAGALIHASARDAAARIIVTFVL